jgi:predicted RNA-binding protein with EMAP domain
MRQFKGSVLSVEVSRNLLKSIAKSSMLENTIVPIYGKIRLFVSRAPHSYLKPKDVVYSARNEKFLFKREDGISETFSDKDYSITKKLDELKDMGYNKFYVNLSRSNLDRKFITELIKSINLAKGMKNTSQFNYFLNLK